MMEQQLLEKEVWEMLSWLFIEVIQLVPGVRIPNIN
jgi:hypothetical protein